MRKLKHLLFLILFTCIIGNIIAQNNNQDTTQRYIKVPAGYLMVLRQGDDVLAHIEDLATKEKIPAANYTGMGFVNVTFGFLIFKRKNINQKHLMM